MSRSGLGVFLRPLVALALVASALTLSVPSALATVACSGSTNVFDGTDPPGNQNYGVRASLERRIPSLCGAGWSASSLWVMTTGGCAEEYIQSGYLRRQGQAFNVYPFAEYDLGVGTNQVHKELANAVPAGSLVYSTKYNFSSGAISAIYNGTTLLSVNIDTAWCVGRGSQFEAEVFDNGDDVPGSVADHASVSTMQKIAGQNGVWVNLVGQTISSESNRYAVDWAAAQTHMRVWTK